MMAKMMATTAMTIRAVAQPGMRWGDSWGLVVVDNNMLLVVESTRFVVVVVVVDVVLLELVGEASVMSVVVTPVVELAPSAAVVVVISLLVVVAVVVVRVELVTGMSVVLVVLTNDAVLISSSLRLSRMPWTTKPTIAAPVFTSCCSVLSTFTPLASRLTILGPITC